MTRTKRHLAPDEREEVKQRIAFLAQEGMTTTQIAKTLRMNRHTVIDFVKRMREAGDIPPFKECVKSRTTPYQAMRKARVRYLTKTGSFAIMAANLTKAEIEWVHKITPEGATVAHTLASIVRDAYAEECCA